MIDIKRFYDKWGFYPIAGAGDLGDGTGSSYPGALDTDTNKEVDDPDAGATLARADVPNDRAAAIVNIETELGIDPAGTLTDVKTWLQTEHNADGTHGAITASGDARINAGLGVNIAPPATGDLSISGIMQAGIVPLARMGTSVLDSSTAVGPNTEGSITIQAANSSHRFYSAAIRGTSSDSVNAGARVDGAEAVQALFHSVINRPGSAGNDVFEFANGTPSSITAVYKIYDLTET